MVHPLIEAGQLRDHLHDTGLRVVDVRFSLADPGQGRRAYEAAHIPGAVYLDLERDLSGPAIGPGGRHPLPDPALLARRLGEVGIGGDTWVVAYDAQNSEFAGRLWWLLRYLGHDSVQILDGGLRAWEQIGGPLTAEVPMPVAARFEPHPRPELVVAAHEDVERAARARELVDSRAGPRYRGEVEPLDRRAGHIPGALHYDFTRTLSSDGRFRPVPELQERFAGLPSRPVVYCGSGVTATVNVVAMTIAGMQPRLYAGSFSDWVDSDARPVATGPEHADPEEAPGQA
ncbi:MAG: sulfurtransferase [Clostridia bacterium]